MALWGKPSSTTGSYSGIQVWLDHWPKDIPLHFIFGVQLEGTLELRPRKLANLYLRCSIFISKLFGFWDRKVCGILYFCAYTYWWKITKIVLNWIELLYQNSEFATGFLDEHWSLGQTMNSAIPYVPFVGEGPALWVIHHCVLCIYIHIYYTIRLLRWCMMCWPFWGSLLDQHGTFLTSNGIPDSTDHPRKSQVRGLAWTCHWEFNLVDAGPFANMPCLGRWWAD